MSSLPELLLDPSRRDQVVAALVGTIEAEVQTKSGLSGMALKTAFKAVQKISPDLVHRAVNGMLPDMAARLDPMWRAKGDQPFGVYLPSRADEAADALLAVADERARQPKHAAVAKVYNTVRPKAKSQVIDALPAVGRTIDSVAV